MIRWTTEELVAPYAKEKVIELRASGQYTKVIFRKTRTENGSDYGYIYVDRKPEPVTKTFHIDKEWEGWQGETILWEGDIRVDQRILDAVNDDWRAHLYKLMDDQAVAEHIAFNFVVNRGIDRVQQLDGWADQPDDVVCEIVR